MPIFEVLEPTQGVSPPPGPWASRPAPAAAFSTGGDPEAGAAIWRANLPADPLEARVALGAAAASLRAQEQALDQAARRMGRAARGGASFSSAGAPSPEQEMLAVLYDARPEDEGASFGIGDSIKGAMEEAQEQFQTFVNQVFDTVANFAVVETRVGGVLIGRTSVGWGGDTRTLMAAGVTADQALLHRRTLALALRSRAALLRSLAVITRGAGIVATAVSSPAGPLLALPAAWKFVDQLIKETKAPQNV